MQSWNTRRRNKKQEKIYSCNNNGSEFSKINNRHQTIDPESSEDTKQKKNTKKKSTYLIILKMQKTKGKLLECGAVLRKVW